MGKLKKDRTSVLVPARQRVLTFSEVGGQPLPEAAHFGEARIQLFKLRYEQVPNALALFETAFALEHNGSDLVE
jgi:hypothetical protein